MIPFLIGAIGAGEGGAGSYSLSPPTNFSVTDQSDCNGCSFDYQAYLSWTTGEPTAETRIYRNGALVHTAAAGVSNWTDTAALSEDSYSYSIRHWDDPDVSPVVSDSIDTDGTCEDSLSAPTVSPVMQSTTQINVYCSGGGTDRTSWDVHLSNGTYLGNTVTGTFEHTGLDPGTQYTYKAKARSDTDCLSGYGATASAYTKIATPTGATTATGPDTIECDVSALPTGATGVQVRRNGTDFIGTITSPGTPVEDTGLNAETLYNYTYKAVGTPPSSDEDSDSDTTLAGVPGSFTATHDTTDCADAGTTVNLAWSNRGNNVSQIKIERKEPGEGSYSVLIASLAAGSTAYADTTASGLGNGTTYYRISFVFSTQTQYGNASKTVSCIPAVPTGVSVSWLEPTATITWTDASTLPAEAGFKIYRAPDVGGLPGTWSQIDTKGAGVEIATDEPAEGTWHYAVASYSSWGTSSKVEASGNPITNTGEA